MLDEVVGWAYVKLPHPHGDLAFLNPALEPTEVDV
jgi:hypothetical protein